MRFSVNAKKALHIKKNGAFLIFILAASLTALTGCSCLISAPAPPTDPKMVQGYLPKDQSPNSLTLLPAPPAPTSAAFAADQEAFRTTRALRNTPRWSLAVKDANLNFPEAPQAFSCALNAPITADAMPNLYVLMRRSMTDAGAATRAAKNHYKRVRPFVENKETSCTPDDESFLARNGSYPSGHTSAGWTWALILAEIAPERADAILSRGLAFGQSRVICGVHWQSDVTAGRVVAAAVVARLHTDPVFRAQIKAARKEWLAAQARGLKPSVDCQAETAALAF